MINSAGTDPIKAFILKGFGIAREQAPDTDVLAGAPKADGGMTAENFREDGTCCMKISPKDENILVFGEISPVIPFRFPLNMKIMI